jgi:antitoxin HicB
MREPHDKAILMHMPGNTQDILDFTYSLDIVAFKNNTHVKKAVSMSLLNIGELAKELPISMTIQYPLIPWKNIIGLRNRTAHGYHSLDDSIVWEISIKDIPSLSAAVEDALTLYLYHLEETGIPLPAASDIKAIPEDTTVYVMSADTLEYREIFDNTAVKKTLTIPRWMNKAAEKQGVNFSQLLQSAIKNQLSSHGDR